jgi:hypothetical protein
MLIMRNSGSIESPQDTDLESVINAMGAYNESMITAGVLVGGDGLTDAARGAVVEFTGSGAPLVSAGAYGEDHTLFNGFWTIEVPTQEEAVAWAARAPLGAGNKIEVRRLTDATDFADYADNEFVQKEKEWRQEQTDRPPGE